MRHPNATCSNARDRPPLRSNASAGTNTRAGRKARPRAGLSLIEVVVLLALAALAAMFLVLGASQARERGRLANCRNNLAHIGFGLALYDQIQGRLPEVGPLGPLDAPDAPAGGPRPPGPLKTVLETLKLPDLLRLKNGEAPPVAPPGAPAVEGRVPGFVCPADRNALEGRFRAPISYRATTGDTTRGDNGAFAPGRMRTLTEIEVSDGMSYTAAFSERLVGDGRNGRPARFNYRAVAPPLPAAGCPEGGNAETWRGDAGSSWAVADYRSTLYNHAATPNAPTSCVATDGRSAQLGASSGHVGGVNLLMLDGSVSLVRPSINRKVWQAHAAISAQAHATGPSAGDAP